MATVFYWLLNISILATLGGLVVFILRKIKSLPRFGIYVLWIITWLRFWFPLGIAFRYSLLSLIARYTSKTIIVWQGLDQSSELTASNFVQAVNQYQPMRFRTEFLEKIFTVGGWLWVIVAFMALITATILYCLTRSGFLDARKLKDNIHVSDNVQSPVVFGVLKPRIILPTAFEDSNLEYVLKHENIHIRRLDNIWRVLAIVTACVHCLNPFAWIMLRSFLIDIELACDEAVLKQIGEAGRGSYASALLNYSTKHNYFASAFNGTKTRLRIERVLSYKSLTLLATCFFIVFFVFIAIALITNALS